MLRSECLGSDWMAKWDWPRFLSTPHRKLLGCRAHSTWLHVGWHRADPGHGRYEPKLTAIPRERVSVGRPQRIMTADLEVIVGSTEDVPGLSLSWTQS